MWRWARLRPRSPTRPHSRRTKSALVARTCLIQKERHAEVESGRVVRLTVALHAAKSRMAGTLVRARLCHGHNFGHNGLVYVLTVLAHDGKVAQLTIDAAKGTLVGGLLSGAVDCAFSLSKTIPISIASSPRR